MKYELRDAQALGVESRKYLEHRGDGTVWCVWADGRWIEVVPKGDYEHLRVVLQATQKALREMQAQRDKAREGKR